MSDQPPANTPPPPPGGYPPPPQGGQPGQPAGGYPPPPAGGYPPPPPGSYPPPPPGSYPPPPAGNYPPPPQGGYPPPPTGGYPPAGFPPPGGFGASYRFGDAFNWAWSAFTRHAAPLMLAALAYVAIIFALSFLFSLVLTAFTPGGATTVDPDSFFDMFGVGGTLTMVVGVILLLFVSGVITSAFLNGLLAIADGQQIEFASFFRPRNVGSVVIATVIVGVLSYIGTALCVVPGLIVSLFAMFTTVAVVDRNLSPIDGILASVDVVKKNFGPAILVWLASGVLIFLGSLLCGVGLLITGPLAGLLVVCTFRRLTGAPVAPQAV